MTHERRAWWSWFLPFLWVCGIWSIASPVFAPPDEPGHVMRAAAIARGQVTGPDQLTLVGFQTALRVPATFVEMAAAARCFVHEPTSTPACVAPLDVEEQLTTARNGFGRYPPLYYFAIAQATLVARSPKTVYLGRLVTAAVTAAFLASALVSARRLGRWSVIGVAAGITPMTFYLGGAVNPSGVELAAALALWASAAALARAARIDTRLVVRAALAFFVLANVRGLSLPIAIVALGTPLALASRARIGEIWRLHGTRLCALLVTVGFAAALAWGFSVGRGRVSPLAKPVTYSIPEGLTETPRIFEQSIAWFGSFEVRDLVAIAIWAVIWSGLLVVALGVGDGRERALLVALVVVGVAFPISVSMYHPPPIFTSWQGRHSLPLWCGVPVVAATILAGSARARSWLSRRLAVGVALALAVGNLTAFIVTARRYAVGAGGKILYVVDPTWTGPLHPAILVVLMAVGLVAAYRNVAFPPGPDFGVEPDVRAPLATAASA